MPRPMGFAPAFGRASNGDYCGDRDKAAAIADLEVGRLEPQTRRRSGGDRLPRQGCREQSRIPAEAVPVREMLSLPTILAGLCSGTKEAFGADHDLQCQRH
jgi:hypothetical protein